MMLTPTTWLIIGAAFLAAIVIWLLFRRSKKKEGAGLKRARAKKGTKRRMPRFGRRRRRRGPAGNRRPWGTRPTKPTKPQMMDSDARGTMGMPVGLYDTYAAGMNDMGMRAMWKPTRKWTPGRK